MFRRYFSRVLFAVAALVFVVLYVWADGTTVYDMSVDAPSNPYNSTYTVVDTSAHAFTVNSSLHGQNIQYWYTHVLAGVGQQESGLLDETIGVGIYQFTNGGMTTYWYKLENPTLAHGETDVHADGQSYYKAGPQDWVQ
jgi:hypothetical protein